MDKDLCTRLAIFMFFCVWRYQLPAQQILGLSSFYDDSLHEWVLHTDQDNVEGTIINPWHHLNQWGQWNFRLGEIGGTIQTKWHNDLNHIEYQAGRQLVIVRTIFTDRFDYWEISGRGFKVNLEYIPQDDIWVVFSHRDTVEAILYTDHCGDIRDWIIELPLSDEFPFMATLACYFTPILISTIVE